MLDIFPLEMSENVVCGDAVLRALQDHSTPLIDLIVRESLQNSLDAAASESSMIKVEFNLLDANSEDIMNVLNLDTDVLPETKKVLEIRDSGTEGLTGHCTFKDVKEINETGNYLKLVCSFGVNQIKEGAGGSWGLGKTIFYRLGLGLVFYYSRLSSGESRLAACWIEDMSKEGGILRKKGITTGVCWWGKVLDNKFFPITDNIKINTIINNLGCRLFNENETGTSIIIPFLKSDFVEKYLSQDDIIKNCILKWYTPRLSNYWIRSKELLESGPQLEVLVDDKKVIPSNEPFFELIQALHRFAITNDDSIITVKDDFPKRENWHREIIKYSSNIIGWFAWVEINGNDLKLSNGKPNIDKILSVDEENIYGGNEGGGLPLVALTRRPGMIVQYTDKWGPYNNKVLPNTWIIGLFVVNSKNHDIEEYFRSCETANHMKWTHPNDSKINYIRHIKRKIKNILDEKLKLQTINLEKELAFNISRQIADIFMPKDGFGTAPYMPPKSNNRGSSIRRHAKLKIIPSLEVNDIVYDNKGKCLISFTAYIPKSKNFQLEICTVGENTIINALKWNDKCRGIDIPFKVEDLEITKFSDFETKNEIANLNTEINKKDNTVDIKFPSSDGKDLIIDASLFFEMRYKDLSFLFTISELEK